MTKFILSAIIMCFLGCSKTASSGACVCATKTKATLKIYHDIQCITTPCFRHELILENGEKAVIQNLGEFKIEEVDQKIEFCSDYVLESYPPQMHITCLESTEKVENIKTPCAQKESVTIEDHTGFDGCTWLFKTTDNTILEPINIDVYKSALKNGNIATVSFEYVNDMASICMMGKMIKICTLEVTQIAK